MANLQCYYCVHSVEHNAKTNTEQRMQHSSCPVQCTFLVAVKNWVYIGFGIWCLLQLNFCLFTNFYGPWDSPSLKSPGLEEKSIFCRLTNLSLLYSAKEISEKASRHAAFLSGTGKGSFLSMDFREHQQD